MDEEQVKSLIAAALGDFETKITTAIDGKNAGLAASLTREIKKLVPEKPEKPADDPKPASQNSEGESEGRLTLKMLQQQLQQQTELINSLKTESERKDKEAFNARKASALMQSITKHKAINPTALSKLLNLEFGDTVKVEGDAWMIEAGDSVKSLDDAVAAYLATDEGKAFLPPSGTAGAGSSESKPTTGTATALTANEALMAAF